MGEDESVKTLMDLGLNQLEAEVYALLLSESPATGYRIAQVLGKPAAGIYKAIESLGKQGAVDLDDGQTRLCRAVPVDELLAQLEGRFAERKKRAAAALARIRRAEADDRVYQLQTPEQVFQRCREMLSRCEDIALFDVFPQALEHLRPEIEAAAERGLYVALHVYQPITLPGAHIITDPNGELILDRWPGQWLNLVTDGRELLYAFLSADGASVHQAVWSSSAYLAWLGQSGLAGEMTASRLAERIHRGAGTEQLKAILDTCERLCARNAPGYRELLRRFALQKE
jgi:sugar-specific transcriptional regulator TrmB